MIDVKFLIFCSLLIGVQVHGARQQAIACLVFAVEANRLFSEIVVDVPSEEWAEGQSVVLLGRAGEESGKVTTDAPMPVHGKDLAIEPHTRHVVNWLVGFEKLSDQSCIVYFRPIKVSLCSLRWVDVSHLMW